MDVILGSKGKAIATAAASACGCIFLVVLLILWTARIRRRREGYVGLPTDKAAGLPRRLPFNLPTRTNPDSDANSLHSRRAASSVGRSSMRSSTSYFTDSTARSMRRLSSRLLSNSSARSSREDWVEYMSRSSTSGSSEWQLDELGAAARMRAIHGWQLQLAVPMEVLGPLQLGRIEEEGMGSTEWI